MHIYVVCSLLYDWGGKQRQLINRVDGLPRCAHTWTSSQGYKSRHKGPVTRQPANCLCRHYLNFLLVPKPSVYYRGVTPLAEPKPPPPPTSNPSTSTVSKSSYLKLLWVCVLLWGSELFKVATMRTTCNSLTAVRCFFCRCWLRVVSLLFYCCC